MRREQKYERGGVYSIPRSVRNVWTVVGVLYHTQTQRAVDLFPKSGRAVQLLEAENNGR